VNHEFIARRDLPSGHIYSLFVGIEDDFSWEIDAVISFSLSPDAIISLFSSNTVNSQEDLSHYERSMAGQIEEFILRRIDLEGNLGQIETMLNNGENPRYEREILDQFPLLHTCSLKVKSAKLPDFVLYRQAKGAFEDYLAVQKDYISGDIRERAKSRVDSMLRFDELELYGALLTKYPILLEYLALENSKK
jgi:hypothetical protein